MLHCFFCGKLTTQDTYCEICTTCICKECDTHEKPLELEHDIHDHLGPRVDQIAEPKPEDVPSA